MNRSVVCESWWKSLIQQLSLNMFLDFNENYFYLNPGGIFVLLYLFLSLLNGCLWRWSTDLTLNLRRRRFTALMSKCKNPTCELVLAILLVHKCWSWIRGWKLDMLAGIGISKKSNTPKQPLIEIGNLLLWQSIPGFSISFLWATVQPQYGSERDVLLSPHYWNQIWPSQLRGFSLQTGFRTISTFCTSSSIPPARRPACLTLSPPAAGCCVGGKAWMGQAKWKSCRVRVAKPDKCFSFQDPSTLIHDVCSDVMIWPLCRWMDRREDF